MSNLCSDDITGGQFKYFSLWRRGELYRIYCLVLSVSWLNSSGVAVVTLSLKRGKGGGGLKLLILLHYLNAKHQMYLCFLT